ncbi:MAG: glycosyltransferase family 10 [Lachnospiraceae bacterium]|nr:glycosyltransferase family 10 [Lachnospiraceae bacterium]
MKFAVIPWVESLMKDHLFEVDNAIENPDNRYTPYSDMKAEFERRGDQFHTIDMYEKLEEIDWFLFFEQNPVWMERIIRAGKASRMVYCNAEPPAVYPWNSPEGYKKLRKFFPYIMTWNDEWVDHQTVFKRTIPYYFQDHREPVPWESRKLLTSISGNKKSTDRNELYSERERVITYFEKNEKGQFDFYGTGWSKETHPAYGGTVVSKAEVLKKYKFAICFENSQKLPGYITEKILDCFTSGIVPIYAGAPNVKQYIPENTFIDYFQFETLEELDDFLKEITEKEYQNYLQAADEFLKSSGIEIFMGKRYAECIYELTKCQKEFCVKRTDFLKLCMKNRIIRLKKNIKQILVYS